MSVSLHQIHTPEPLATIEFDNFDCHRHRCTDNSEHVTAVTRNSLVTSAIKEI